MEMLLGSITSGSGLAYLFIGPYWQYLPTLGLTIFGIVLIWHGSRKSYISRSDLLELTRNIAAEAAKEALKPQIAILDPIEGQRVDFKYTVKGSVHPADNPIQVLVFAGDNRWYPQWPAEIKGTSWSVMCQFGDDKSRTRKGSYQIIAISGAGIDKAISELPASVTRSEVIHVTRDAEGL